MSFHILCSAFLFESFLGTQIKGIATGGFKPLQRIAKFVTKLILKFPEVELFKNVDAYGKIKHFIHGKGGKCFESLKLMQNTTVKVNTCLNGRDSAIQTVDRDIGIIHAIHDHNEMLWILIQTFETGFFAKLDTWTPVIISRHLGWERGHRAR